MVSGQHSRGGGICTEIWIMRESIQVGGTTMAGRVVLSSQSDGIEGLKHVGNSSYVAGRLCTTPWILMAF